MKTNADIQRALIALGYDLGKGGPSGKGDDGVFGALSRGALSSYQRAQGLKATGAPDADTMRRLFPALVVPTILPPWYAEARRLMGTREVAGSGNSGIIMGWARRLGLWYPDDETAWCGLFVAHCISFTLPTEPQPSGPLGARNWLKFGRELKTPAIGAVMVFSRPGSSWSGHVGFYAGESDIAYRILGGNQSNAVNENWIAKSRLLGARWPTSYALPSAGRVRLSSAGAVLSHNEA